MTSPPSSTRHIFQRLSRQPHGTYRSGSDLEVALGIFRQERQNVLIEVEVTGGSLGHLLLQGGRLVYARHGETQDDAALAVMRAQLGYSRLRLLLLDDDQAALACAAVDGVPCPTGALHGSSYGELLSELARQSFTGVAAIEYGRQFVILRFHHGQLANLQATTEVPRVVRLTQIAWQERELGELRGFGNWAPAPATPVPVVAADSAQVWRLFQEIMGAQLGERAPRVIATTRASLPHDLGGGPLSVQLARQVERVAGSAAARDFLSRSLPDTPHAEPH